MLEGKTRCHGMKMNGKNIIEAKMNGNLLFSSDTYYVEYSINIDEEIEGERNLLFSADGIYPYIPVLYSEKSSLGISGKNIDFKKIAVCLKDGSFLNTLDCKCKDVERIRLWYPKYTTAVQFVGTKDMPHAISKLYYLNYSNFGEYCFEEMFYNSRIESFNFDTVNIKNEYIDPSGETGRVAIMKKMFYGCKNLKEVKIDKKLYIRNSLESTFDGCSSLINADLTGIRTPYTTGYNRINMKYLFKDCSSLKHVWFPYTCTISVSDARGMFWNCNSIKHIYLNWLDISQVDIDSIFANCTSLESYSSERTIVAENSSFAFYNCENLKEVTLSYMGAYDPSQGYDASYTFDGCVSLETINFVKRFDDSIIDSVNNMSYMFSECKSLKKLDLSSWDTQYVTEFEYMLQDVPVTTEIIVTDDKWTLSEPQCSWNGTFTRL